MSIDEIAHLDWQPGDRDTSLRERAAQAYGVKKTQFEHELLQIAHEQIVEILDEMTAWDLKVEITNLKDGDGIVSFSIDGIPLRVKVVFPSGREYDQGPTTVSLQVQKKTGSSWQSSGEKWEPITSLEELGRLIAGGEVKCATD